MVRLACVVVLTLVVACGGGAGGRGNSLPATVPAGAPPPTLKAAPSVESTPGVTSPAGVRGAEQRAAAGAGTLGSTLALVVRVGAAEFVVEQAVTPAQRIQGLSGRQDLAPRNGMLFIFEQEGRHTFWMKDMLFPLDLVWIGTGCTVADITRDAPPPSPGQTLAELPRYLPVAPARYVLEINAGEVDLVGLRPGDPVAFSGRLAGLYGC